MKILSLGAALRKSGMLFYFFASNPQVREKLMHKYIPHIAVKPRHAQ